MIFREAELKEMGLATSEDGMTLGVFSPKTVKTLSILRVSHVSAKNRFGFTVTAFGKFERRSINVGMFALLYQRRRYKVRKPEPLRDLAGNSDSSQSWQSRSAQPSGYQTFRSAYRK